MRALVPIFYASVLLLYVGSLYAYHLMAPPVLVNVSHGHCSAGGCHHAGQWQVHVPELVLLHLALILGVYAYTCVAFCDPGFVDNSLREHLSGLPHLLPTQQQPLKQRQQQQQQQQQLLLQQRPPEAGSAARSGQSHLDDLRSRQHQPIQLHPQGELLRNRYCQCGPGWCELCAAPKPERAYHSSHAGRCVLRLVSGGTCADFAYSICVFLLLLSFAVRLIALTTTTIACDVHAVHVYATSRGRRTIGAGGPVRRSTCNPAVCGAFLSVRRTGFVC
jgi:hypothetical protein